MNRYPLILITDGEPQHQRSRVGELWRSFPANTAPPIKSFSLSSILADEDLLPDAGVVWLLLDDAEASELFEIIGIVQERHLPALLTRGDEPHPLGYLIQDGVTICPPATEPGIVMAMLQSLLAQAPVFAAMNGELKLMHVQQGGLSRQIGKIDEEMRLAAKLQREFLPRELPQIGDVHVAAFWRPAGYVSGDIYDVVRLDEDHIGLFIADAVGHGVSAALMAMYIKRSLRTKRLSNEEPPYYKLVEPCDALAAVNRDMVAQQNGQVRFATAAYAILNCKTRKMCIARAGHPYPFVLRANGRTQSIEPEGGLLGVFSEETFEQAEVTLDIGDRLILYSDGFEVAFPQKDETTGKTRRATEVYAAEFEKLREGSPQQAITNLRMKLDNATGSLNQQDDLTVLCVAVGEQVKSEAAPPIAAGARAG